MIWTLLVMQRGFPGCLKQEWVAAGQDSSMPF